MCDLFMNEYQKLAMRTDSFNYDESNPEGFSTEDSIERRDHDPNGESDMPEVRDES